MTVERDLSLIDNSKSRDANDNLDPLVYQLDVADESAWTHFLAEHSQANLYHTIVWRDLLVDAASCSLRRLCDALQWGRAEKPGRNLERVTEVR